MPSKTTKKSAAQFTEDAFALDFFKNFMARMGYQTPSLPEATEYEMVRLSNNYYLLLTLYRNHWIARRIVDLPAIDMTRAWPKLTSQLTPEQIQKFDRTINRTCTPRDVRTALQWGRLYGGGGALIAIKGHEKILDEPLDLDDVEIGSYLGLIPFDRWVGIYPIGAVADDPDHPTDWGLPEFYEARGPDTGESFRVHRSRIMRFLGPPVPTPEFQAQIYWGISVLELVYEELRKRDNASWAILQLLFRAQILARIDPELAQVLSGANVSTMAQQRLYRTLELQNELLSSQSMLVIGKDGDMKATQYSFAGIGEVYAQFQMDIAGAAEIPVTRLFGRTVTGLGQSNDADERYYEEMISEKQTAELKPQLEKLYPVICMSEFGEVPDDLDMTFPSIRVLTEEEKADKAEKASAPIIAAYNAGLIWEKTAKQELRELSDSTGIFTNITDEEIDQAKEESVMEGEMARMGEPGESPDDREKKAAKPNPRRQEKELAGGAEDGFD